MLIAVTGSSGKLGQYVVRELLAHGHEVVPIDIKPSSDAGGQATRVVDVARASELVGLFRGVEAVCHLGNFPTINKPPLTDGVVNNVGSTHAVFEAAAQTNVKTIVYASSIQAYGVIASRAEVSPTAPRYLPVDEDHPLLPRDAYPLSKAMGEWVAESFTRRDPKLSVYSLRLTGIIEAALAPLAPGKKPAVGASLLTAIHVLDAARAVRLCCEQGRAGHTPLNIVSPHSVVNWEMRWLSEYYGCAPEMRRSLGTGEALITSDRATQLLGFTAIHPVARPVVAA
jgi:nucleoside-diphosphate-sugar epimerase